MGSALTVTNASLQETNASEQPALLGQGGVPPGTKSLEGSGRYPHPAVGPAERFLCDYTRTPCLFKDCGMLAGGVISRRWLMGILQFSNRELKGRPIKRDDGWYLFLGPDAKRPKGHPQLRRGPRGKAILDVGQVWVEIPTDMLWVVRSFWKGSAHPSYPHYVELTPYYRGRYQYILSEASLRKNMQVWEDAIGFSADLMARVEFAAHNDPTSPWKGRQSAGIAARSFLGIDAQGNRLK